MDNVTSPAPGPAPRDDFLFAMVASLLAFVLSIACFAPRFMLWSWIDLDPDEHHPPEFNRAIDTLRQLDHPFTPIANPTNAVINWRLLFPLLGHVLRLPRWAFLALPSLGCLLVLAYVAILVRRDGGTRLATLAATALSATTSWFFVSTGWLAYFDSWYVLGLLVAAFSRSTVAAAAACLLCPWVDERFVLSLPLVVLVRGIRAGTLERGVSKRFRSEVLLFVALVAAYCTLRLIALLTAQDLGSAAHLRGRLASVHLTGEVIDGLWSGLRALWAFAIAAPILLARRQRLVQAALLALLVVATAAANAPIAADLSRAASTLVPAAVLGIVLVVRAEPKRAVWPLAAALAFNLLTPARHVIEGWREGIEILPLHVELNRLKHPPQQLALFHLARAGKFGKERQPMRALAEIETASRIDPTMAVVHLSKALLLDEMGKTAEAAACYDRAVSLAPGVPEAYFQRARFRIAHGEKNAAAEDLRAAIDLTPTASPTREALNRSLAQLLRSTGGQ
jgi:tetratricopeptide (TPR) repeat protein